MPGFTAQLAEVVLSDNGVHRHRRYTWAGYTTNWWFVILDRGRYLTSTAQTNGIWRCPVVRDTDIGQSTTAFYHQVMEGYGPLEDNLTGVRGVIRYGLDRSGRPLGSRKLTGLRSQVWLMGDVGVPKVSTPSTGMPTAYFTEIVTYQPTAWGFTVGGSILKQPACRHDGRAVFTGCDGHAAALPWRDLKDNKDDTFGLNSLR